MAAFKKFDQLGISTQTVIADSGMTMEIEEFFRRIPIDDTGGEEPPPEGSSDENEDHRPHKKQGVVRFTAEDERVRDKLASPEYQQNRLDPPDMWIRMLPDVRCRAMYYKNEIKKHPTISFRNREKYFRNALNVILSIGTKLINFKLSKNGKFQLTGCKYLWHAQISVVAFLRMIRRWCPELSQPNIRVHFQTVMTNVDFNVGHTIDRSNLDHHVNSLTPYYSLLETSFGYTGVNIKFPIVKEWWKQMLVPVVYMDEDDRISCRTVVLDEMLKDSDRQRLHGKDKYNTFLVFHSGNVIMSGMSPQLMEKDYDMFTSLLQKWSKDIRETILA